MVIKGNTEIKLDETNLVGREESYGGRGFACGPYFAHLGV